MLRRYEVTPQEMRERVEEIRADESGVTMCEDCCAAGARHLGKHVDPGCRTCLQDDCPGGDCGDLGITSEDGRWVARMVNAVPVLLAYIDHLTDEVFRYRAMQAEHLDEASSLEEHLEIANQNFSTFAGRVSELESENKALRKRAKEAEREVRALHSRPYSRRIDGETIRCQPCGTDPCPICRRVIGGSK